MKYRILEIIDGNGNSIFVPQFFNKYEGLKIFKFFANRPDQWWNYGLGQRTEFKTLEEAEGFLKALESSCVIHEYPKFTDTISSNKKIPPAVPDAYETITV